jgi:hypothetical protein
MVKETAPQTQPSKENIMVTKPEPAVVAEDAATVTEQALSGKPEFPGQTLGIVALVLSFFTQIPALVLGIIAWVWSNRAGVSNVPAKVAVAVSITLMVLGLLVVIGWIVFIAATVGDLGMGGFGPMGMGFWS